MNRDPWRPWTRRERALVEELYPDATNRALAARLGRPTLAVAMAAQAWGLGKSPAFLAGAVGAPPRRPGRTKGVDGGGRADG